MAVNAEIERARRDLRELVYKDISSAPIVLRLAYASQFSYAKSLHLAAETSCSTDDQAKIKTDQDPVPPQPKTDVKQTTNNRLTKAIELCGEIKAKHPTITVPDIYQLAGIVAVEVMRGPSIDFFPGRKDLSIQLDEGSLPDGKQGPSELRDVFSEMELSDKDVVALSGGLKLARAGTKEPLKFDNSYFVELRKDSSGLAELPTQFHYYVDRYAKSEEAFFKDYAESHKKLSEFGFTLHTSFIYSAVSNSPLAAVKNIPVAQRAVGVAVAAAVVILSFFYLINRRRAGYKHSSQQFQ